MDVTQDKLASYVRLSERVPVIVDAASEYDLKGFIAQGADIALYSSHKFLGGPTGGIVAALGDGSVRGVGVGFR